MEHGRTKVGRFIHSTWINLNLRCGNGKYTHLRKEITLKKSKTYDSIYIHMPFEEFKQFCWANKDIIEVLIRPSLDRLDKTKHYTIDNIQIIELTDNIRKEKIKEVNGKVKCYRCKQVKDLESMAVDKRRQNGHKTICKRCDVQRKCVPIDKRK